MLALTSLAIYTHFLINLLGKVLIGVGLGAGIQRLKLLTPDLRSGLPNLHQSCTKNYWWAGVVAGNDWALEISGLVLM